MFGAVQNLFLATLLIAGANCDGYQGYKVYQVTPKTEAQADLLHQLHNDPNFDFFKDTRILGKPSDIMVSPQVQWYFEEALKNLTHDGLEYKILLDNVQEILDQEAAELQKAQVSPRASRNLFDRYLAHDEVLAYLHTLEREYPNNVRLESIGRSFEGRDLLLIHIGHGHNPNRPTIFIDAGIHAREWAATPAALYIINQLVENPSNAGLIQHVNWATIPSLNPDGYEFSRSSSLNRLWRKTRRPNPNNNCIGTDGNRNFGYHWMESGASQNPCDDIYAGPQPFSEPETAAVQRYLLAQGRNIKLYATIHSYGEYILYPWGYTSALPADVAELQSLGEAAARAIEQVSTLRSKYTIGSSTNVLYAAAGGSDDWAKGVAGIDLSYTFELPAGGLFGFNPPVSLIRPIVEETFAAFRVLGSYIERKFS